MELTTGEKEKKQLAAAVRKRLIGNSKSILHKKLLDKKIPLFFNNYLQNSVQKIIHTEEPVQFNNSKRFDFEYGKIKQLRSQLIKEFEKAIIFSKEELTEIINKTVYLQFDLIIKPGPTLLKIFYRNRSDRVQNELLQILSGLNDDRIFLKILIKNIKEFDQYHIVEEDFKKLLRKTRKDVYYGDFETAFLSDVSTLINFIDLIQGENKQKISINLIMLLLKERNSKQYNPIFENCKKEYLKMDEISSLIETINNNSNSNDDIEKIIKAPGVSESNKNIKERKKLKITNIGKDPMDMVINRNKIGKQPDGPIHSLELLITAKDKKNLLKTIFGNSEKSFNNFIQQLESVKSWKEAKIFIDKELSLRSIEPYSKEALRLGDLIFNRYFPKKS